MFRKFDAEIIPYLSDFASMCQVRVMHMGMLEKICRKYYYLSENLPILKNGKG